MVPCILQWLHISNAVTHIDYGTLFKRKPFNNIFNCNLLALSANSLHAFNILVDFKLRKFIEENVIENIEVLFTFLTMFKYNLSKLLNFLKLFNELR